MSSTGYAFEKLYEAIYRPETGHAHLAIIENGYIDTILEAAKLFENQLQSQGCSDEYESVVEKLETLRNYFDGPSNPSIRKQDAYRLREDVYKALRDWNER